MTSFELIGTYREKLDQIREWRPQLSDTILTLSAINLSLAPARGSTDRIPGGDALAMLGPWSADADEGDDLPHPDQVIREWSQTIHGYLDATPPARSTWATHWRYLYDQCPSILESPWAEHWQADITALWWRLARLTGNAPNDEEETLQRQLVDHANELPDHARLTLTELDKTYPGRNLSQRIRTARSKENARARQEHRPARHPFDPDYKRRYLLGDIRNNYPETRPVGTIYATV